MTRHALRSFRPLLSTLAGASLGVAVGCVIVSGSGAKDCGDPGSNSFEVGDDCMCESGYEFCNDDPNDYSCCEIDGGCGPNSSLKNGQCWCDPGYTWCNPDDPKDTSCCPGGGTDGTTTTGTTQGTASGGTTGGVDCPDGAMPDPADCDASAEGVVFCSHSDPAYIECSTLWVCTGGQWMDGSQFADQNCQASGWDWAYGCYDDAQANEVGLVCGSGPGTPCNDGDPSYCVDADQLHACRYGRLSEVSCLKTCQEVGDENLVTYDYGECQDDASGAFCACCDQGDPGCPAGGGTGGSTGG